MNCFRTALSGVLAVAAATLLSVAAPMNAVAAEQTLPLLVTKVGTYTNVTVTTKNKTYVFILHDAGMANIRIQDLTPEALEELGYAPPAEKKRLSVTQTVLAKELMPKVEAKLKPLEASVRERLPYDPQKLKPTKATLGIAVAVLLLVHLFFSYCCHLITIKSKKEATILSWIPVLQSIPLLRAAGMSGWWFLLLWVPLVPILWAFKIARVRDMSVLVSIALLLPVTNFFAFLYLAFGKEAESKDAPKYQSMSLQTA